jgi:hypothetical protein
MISLQVQVRAMSDTSPFGKIKSMMPKLVHLVRAARSADERLSIDALSLRSHLNPQLVGA